MYLFPNFGENLRQDFRRETELFFESIVRENRSVLDLLTADYTFVNERLARHYGIPNVYGSHFRRVTIADENRRGLLGQGSILTVTSLADRTTVVGRGKWILENFSARRRRRRRQTCRRSPRTRAARKVLTLRERMEQHRANPVCASCHARMDPLGFALENFDATGQWRTMEAGKPIDASAAAARTAPSSRDRQACARWLLGQSEQVATAIDREAADLRARPRPRATTTLPAVRKIVHAAASDGYTLPVADSRRREQHAVPDAANRSRRSKTGD